MLSLDLVNSIGDWMLWFLHFLWKRASVAILILPKITHISRNFWCRKPWNYFQVWFWRPLNQRSHRVQNFWICPEFWTNPQIHWICPKIIQKFWTLFKGIFIYIHVKYVLIECPSILGSVLISQFYPIWNPPPIWVKI